MNVEGDRRGGDKVVGMLGLKRYAGRGGCGFSMLR